MFNKQDYSEAVEKGSIIGWGITYTIHQNSVGYETLKDLITQNGLNAAWLPEPSAKKSFSRAGKVLSRKRGDGAKNKKSYEKIKDSFDRVVFGELTLDVDSVNETVGGNSSGKAVFNKENKSVQVEGERADVFIEKYNEFLDVVTRADVQSFIVDTIEQEQKGVRVRPSGGAYFLPTESLEGLHNLDAVLRATGIGEVFSLPIADMKASRVETWNRFEEAMEARVAKIVEDVDKIGKRAGCAVKHIEDIEAQEVILAAYTKLCGEESKSIVMGHIIHKAMEHVTNKVASLKLGAA